MAIESRSDEPPKRPLILVICDYYLPGFESGGAMRTIVNMIERLSDSFEFKVVTRDHDGPLNRESYKDVRIGEWNRIDDTDVYYLLKDQVGPKHLRRLIRDLSPDAIYL